jgi:autotransporter-associated beta strand protein
MNNKPSMYRVSPCLVRIVGLLALLGSIHPLLAVNSVWNGASVTSSNWSDSANWGGTAVASGNTFFFGGTAKQTNYNDVSSLTVVSPTLTNANWNISGNPVTLSGTFTANYTGTSVWNLPTTLSGTVTWVQSGSSDIVNLTGYLSGTGAPKKTSGSAGQGTLILSNPTNSFTGIVQAWTGNLQFTSLAPGGQPSALGAGNSASAIQIGYTGTGYGAALTYIGSTNGTTDRGLAFANSGTTTQTFNNNSPSNSSLTFNGPITFTDGGAFVFATAFGGTSTGTNTFTGGFYSNNISSTVLWGGNLSIAGPGTWAFSNVFNFAGGNLTISTNSHFALLYNSSYPLSEMPGIANITLSSGGTFDVRSYDQNASAFQLGSISGYPQTMIAGRTNGTAAVDINGSLSLAGTAGATLSVAPIGVPGTLTISSNLITGSGVLNFDLNTNSTAGAGKNDLIAVGGNLDLSQGTATINVNVLRGTILVNTPYTLFTYGGSLIGSASGLTVPSPSRAYAAGVISTATPGVVTVTFAPSGLPPANLVWNGTGAQNWDIGTTAGWLYGVSSSVFYGGDNVLFNDASSQPAVNLAGALTPGTITVSNNINNYVLSSSSGGYIASGSLTKQGSGSLTLSTANAYGNTVISAGTVVAANNTALGSGTVTLGDAASRTNTVGLVLGSAVTIANNITVSSSATNTVTISSAAGGSTAGGAITMQRGMTLFNTNAAAQLSITGGILGTGDVTVTGGGTILMQDLSPFNFSGNIYLTPGNTPGLANTTELLVNLHTTNLNNCNLNLASNTLFVDVSGQGFNGLNGSGTISMGTATYNNNVIVGNGNGSGTFSGSLTTNNTGYSVSLIKNGSGTEILTGDNSAAGSGSGGGGQTTVNGGILAVDNTAGYGLGIGGLGVATNGTLAGNGTIYAAAYNIFLVQNGGLISVGNDGDTRGAMFTLICTNTTGLQINAGGALSVDLFSGAGAGDNTGNAAAADVLNAQCPVTLATNGCILNIGNPNGLTGWKIGDKWKIANWQSTPTNMFTTLNLPALPGTLAWDTNSLYSAGVIDIVSNNIVSVPTAPATITGVTSSGGNIIISGTNMNGGSSFHYAVLSSTNLTVPLTNWTVLSTNSFNANGTFNYTNPINPTIPAEFIDVKAVP